MAKLLTIGELSKLSGVRPGMIRYFEAQGVIGAATRTPAGYRLFRQEHVDELKFVQKMQGLGFYTQHIKTIKGIKMSEIPKAEKVEMVQGIFQEHQAHINERIRYFTRLRTKLVQAAPTFVDEVLGDL